MRVSEGSSEFNKQKYANVTNICIRISFILFLFCFQHSIICLTENNPLLNDRFVYE